MGLHARARILVESARRDTWHPDLDHNLDRDLDHDLDLDLGAISAQVNRVFSRAMELGVTVEAYDVSGGRVRHINSGFMVVEALGADAVAVELRASAAPDPTIDPEVQMSPDAGAGGDSAPSCCPRLPAAPPVMHTACKH